MENRNIVKSKNDMDIIVDYWVELYGVISILTSDQKSIHYAGQNRGNDSYRARVLNYFNKYKDSEICKTFIKLSKEYYLNFDGCVKLFLQISNGKINKKEVCELRRNIPDKLFNNIINQIKTFERESKFENFFNSEKDNYLKSIDNFIEDFDKYSSYDFLKNLLKIDDTNKKYIVLMHGITNANYGINTNNNLYCCIRPYKLTRFSSPDFSYDAIYFTTLILHEFAHSYINPLVEKEQTLISKIDKSKYDKYMAEYDYGSHFETYINECIIRAIECLYVKSTFKASYEDYVKDYVQDGYTVIPNLLEILAEYEQNLNNHKDITDIIKNLIECF